MVRLLVLERQEEKVWSWIRQKTSKDHKARPNHIRYSWRATALKSLARVKVELANNQSLDAAIEVFLRACNMTITMPLIATYIYMHKNLWTPKGGFDVGYLHRYPMTSVSHWQAFYNFVSIADKKITRHKTWAQARLRLSHPRDPDPWPCFHILKDVALDPDHHLRQWQKEDAKVSIVEIFRHAQWQLISLGFLPEAEWMHKTMFQVYPRGQEYRDQCDRERITQHGLKSKPLPHWLSKKKNDH